MKKRKTERNVTVGDPNAKALWSRTRSQAFKPKKGKGSFKRVKKPSDWEED